MPSLYIYICDHDCISFTDMFHSNFGLTSPTPPTPLAENNNFPTSYHPFPTTISSVFIIKKFLPVNNIITIRSYSSRYMFFVKELYTCRVFYEGALVNSSRLTTQRNFISLNTWGSKQNNCHFVGDSFKCMFLTENAIVLTESSLNGVQTDYKSALVQMIG